MKSFLTITTPATGLSLLSIEEMREAAGVATGSDAALTAMEARCAASIMSECGIAIGSGGVPTLRRETLTETFYQACGEILILSRRHDVDIASIVEDTVTLVDSDFMVDAESGLLTRFCSDTPSWWSARKVVVVYEAGFDTVPADLKMAAMDFLRSSWLEKGRDPLVKSEETDIPGIMREKRDFWVGSVPGQTNEGAVPDVVSGQLMRFRQARIG